MDISPAMLWQARGAVDVRVEFVADGQATALTDSSADLVVSSLGVLQDTDAGWLEAARLLRPGGRVVLTMWGTNYAERELIAEARRLLGGPPMPAAPLDDALARASRAGCRSFHHQDHSLPVVHPSLRDYLSYQAAFGAPPWVPPGREPDAIDAITTAATRYVNAEGQVVLDWNVTVLSALGRRPERVSEGSVGSEGSGNLDHQAGAAG